MKIMDKQFWQSSHQRYALGYPFVVFEDAKNQKFLRFLERGQEDNNEWGGNTQNRRIILEKFKGAHPVFGGNCRPETSSTSHNYWEFIMSYNTFQCMRPIGEKTLEQDIKTIQEELRQTHEYFKGEVQFRTNLLRVRSSGKEGQGWSFSGSLYNDEDLIFDFTSIPTRIDTDILYDLLQSAGFAESYSIRGSSKTSLELWQKIAEPLTELKFV